MLAAPRVAALARWTLGLNLLVILWGAVVRATGSGAGCGSHWPLCDGQVVPQAPAVATLIEFSHRLTSGLALLLVVGLVVAVFRAFAKGHRVRVAAVAALVLILVEAGIGAVLVLKGLVADDASPARAAYMAGHLLNTFFLLAALTLTFAWSRDEAPGHRWSRPSWLVVGATLLLLATGMSGAVAALGDTLFPAASLGAGLAQDLSPTSHFLLRLRVFHPLLAVAAALALLVVARRELESPRRSPRSTRGAQHLMLLVIAQVAAGIANLALLAPIALQLVHLLLADLVWIVFVLLADEVLSRKGAS